MKLWRALLTGDIKAAWSQPPFWTLDQPLLSTSSLTGDRERIDNDFQAYVHWAYKRNGPVFACVLVRLLVFSEARFLYRRFEGGQPTELFGDASLALLERPWPNGTTGELAAHMEQDVSMAGNFFGTKVGGASPIGRGGMPRLRRMRPDWVTILTGVRSDELTRPDERTGPLDLRAQPLGYIYDPPGSADPVILPPDQVAHYSPIPDPDAQWRGMSWITPVLDEVMADRAATRHKLQFFRRGATPGYAISYSPEVPRTKVKEYIELFKEQHEGADNAYRTLHMGGGADPKPLGATMRQLDFKVTQGAGETRIAQAAGVHPVIVGMSEGMQGSALNAGNYTAVRRRFADGTMRPLWRIAAASLQTLVTPPEGASLWYDERDVAFLREDARDQATILRIRAGVIDALITNGWTPDSAKAAVIDDDLKKLIHTGQLSVQLQPPGSNGSAARVRVPVEAAATLLRAGWAVAPGTEMPDAVLAEVSR